MKFFDKKDNWKTKTIQSSNSGNHHQKYFFKRKKALRVTINTPLANTLAGYALIEKDLRTVSEWLKKLEQLEIKNRMPPKPGFHILKDDHENDLIIKSLYLSSLIFYSKCFAKCEGRKIKLESKNIPQKFQEVHDDIISMRNNYGAHSGKEKYEKVNIVLVLNPKKKYRNESPNLVRELIQPEIMKELPEDEDFKALVEHVRKYVLDKLDTLNNLIFKNEINPKGIDYWYKKAKHK